MRLNRNREILRLIFIGMEMSWLAALFVMLAEVVREPGSISMAAVCILYPISFALARTGLHKKLSPWNPAPVGLALIAVLVLVDFYSFAGEVLTWKKTLVAATGGLFVWIRGWFLAGRQVNKNGMVAGFQAGLVVLVITSLMSGWIIPPGPGAAAPILSFFTCGLLGLWLAMQLEKPSAAGAGALSKWTIVAAVAIGAIIFLGLALFFFMDRQILDLLLKPILWIWEQILALLKALAGLFDQQHAAYDLPEGQPRMPRGEGGVFLWDFKWVKRIAEAAFISSSVLIICAALMRTLQDLLRWMRRRWVLPAGTSIEVMEGGILDDLKALALYLWEKIRRLLKILFRRKSTGAGLNPEQESIRGIYRRMIRWGAAIGRPMEPSWTADEYCLVLSSAAGEAAGDIRMITQEYVKMRYSRNSPKKEQVRQVHSSWKRIKNVKVKAESGRKKAIASKKRISENSGEGK